MIPLLIALTLMLQGPPGSSSVEGFVVQAGTNPLLTLVNARLELAGPGESRIVRTDRTGRFSFGELPAGVYFLSVTKDGYLRKTPGIRVNLKADQAVKDLLVRMDSVPSIEGLIRDPEGNVVFNVMVQALRVTFDSRGRRGLSLFASTRTDDRGLFRLYWLDPGEYYLSAIAPPVALNNQATSAFVPTYFPGFVDIDDAKSIRLDRRRDLTGIDFGLIRQAPATLTGYLSSRTRGALPFTNVNVTVPSDGTGTERYQGKTDRFAQFSIPGVFPGSYIVSSTDGNETGAVRTQIRFDRAGRNAADSRLRVDVVIGPGVGLSGRLGNATQTPMDLRAANVQLTEIDEALPQPMAATIARNGAFTIPAVQPGSYSVSMSGLPDDLYLKDAAFGDADALAKPFAVGPNELKNLVLEIGTDGGRLMGVVYDESNAPFPGAQIVLRPEVGFRFRFDRYRTAITDQDGRFDIRGIAPGDYTLFGWSSIEPNAHLDAEYMRPYESLGTAVRVSPGENPAVGLRAIQAEW